MTKHTKTSSVHYTVLPCPVGWLLVAATVNGVCYLDLSPTAKWLSSASARSWFSASDQKRKQAPVSVTNDLGKKKRRCDSNTEPDVDRSLGMGDEGGHEDAGIVDGLTSKEKFWEHVRRFGCETSSTQSPAQQRPLTPPITKDGVPVNKPQDLDAENCEGHEAVSYSDDDQRVIKGLKDEFGTWCEKVGLEARVICYVALDEGVSIHDHPCEDVNGRFHPVLNKVRSELDLFWESSITDATKQRSESPSASPPSSLPSTTLARKCARSDQLPPQNTSFRFSTPCDYLNGTPFQRKIWTYMYTSLPFGTTTTYSALASCIGNPGAVRAVASANARNPIALVVPCHRVLGKGGELRGYSCGGTAVKKFLLDLETSS